MYTPKAFELNDPDLQHQLIHEYPFGTLVSEGKDKLAATHLPFLLTAGSQGKRLLQAHIAKSNSEFSQLRDGTPVLAVFHGPQAYVSPSWYPSKASTHGKAVPTWNYVAIHVHGTMTTQTDPAWLLEHLRQQTERYERNQPNPWSIDDAPPDYIDAMLRGIIGLEITITCIEAKQKLSQNRSLVDQQSVAESLRHADGSPLQRALNGEISRLMDSNALG